MVKHDFMMLTDVKGCECVAEPKSVAMAASFGCQLNAEPLVTFSTMAKAAVDCKSTSTW